MSSGLIVALEFGGVVGILLGLGVWELLRLRRDRARDDDQRNTRPPRDDPTPPERRGV